MRTALEVPVVALVALGALVVLFLVLVLVAMRSSPYFSLLCRADRCSDVAFVMFMSTSVIALAG